MHQILQRTLARMQRDSNQLFAYLDSSGKISEELMYAQQRSQYEETRKLWEIEAERHTTDTIDKLCAVLQMDGGWLVETDPEQAQAETQRHQEMEVLRRQCIPTVVFMLHKILFETGQYQKRYVEMKIQLVFDTT